MKLIFRLFLITSLAIVLLACGEEETNTIYSSPVHFTVNINNLDNDLNAPMKAKSFTQKRLSSDYIGYGGILVVCSLEPITSNIYGLFAYDLACTHERKANIKVVPNNEGKATCPECGSGYNIFDGSGNVVSGPSKTGLQVYRNVRHDNINPGIFVVQR